jgi:SPP1 gp7 family putative phage head morphogenesis protein
MTFAGGSEDAEDKIRRKLSSLFENMMQALFRQKGAQLDIDILTSDEAQAFINTHASVLDSAFTKTDMSETMRRRLKRSDYIFSGMKTFHELNEAFPSLLDENGERKPFERFLNDVQSIDKTYNQNYLRAEYNFAQSSAQMAAKWEGFMEDGDRYNLQYRTAGDDKVRPQHAALNGVTLPPSDSFWEEFYPPNGWNCRCTVVQVRKTKYPETDHNEAVTLGDSALQNDTKGIFRFNSGKEGKTFPDYNPYTIRRCRDCDIAKGKRKLAKKKKKEGTEFDTCKGCESIHSMADKENTDKPACKSRHDILSDVKNWANTHLPRVDMPNGATAYRKTIKSQNGDSLIVGKKFFSETFTKNIDNSKLEDVIDTAKCIDEWGGSLTYVRTEKGIDHDFDFRVYRAEFKGQTIELKAKDTEGIIVYTMRFI